MPAIGRASDSSLDAEQLIEAARGGSREALGLLMEKWRQYLLLVANREFNPALRGKVGASDVVQETLLQACQNFPDFHGHTQGEMLAWLQRILLNKLANLTRRYVGTDKRALSREVPLDGDDEPRPVAGAVSAVLLSPASHAAAREQAASVERALERLPRHYRLVIRLRHEENLTFPEIGRLMDRSAGAASQLWLRAIERLRLDLGFSDEAP